MRASFTVALANQQINEMTLNTPQIELREALWMSILGTAKHCIDGSEFCPPNAKGDSTLPANGQPESKNQQHRG